MVSFEPVWISSINHLEKFAQIWKKSSLLRKISGAPNIPKSFPQLKPLPISPILAVTRPTPIIFFANGKLTISKLLKFKSTRISFGVIRVKNLSNLNFKLHAKSIKSIERYKFPMPKSIKYFFVYDDINWIRIKNNEKIINGDFLLCVGGKGPSFGRFEKKTDELYKALLEFKNR